MTDKKSGFNITIEFVFMALIAMYIGAVAIQAFLYGLFAVCPDCFVHVGDDVYCVRLEDGNLTYEKNPMRCDDGMWSTRINGSINITTSYGEEAWKRLQS